MLHYIFDGQQIVLRHGTFSSVGKIGLTQDWKGQSQMALQTHSETQGWLSSSLSDVRTAFFEDARDRPQAAAIIRPHARQSTRDVVELVVISVVICTAGLAAVWSTTL